MMRVLFRPKNATSSGTSLGEKELDAYDDGVRGRLEDGLGDCWLSKMGWGTGSSSSIRAATIADHFGVSSPSGVLDGMMQQRCWQPSVGL